MQVDVFISYPQRERELMLPLKQRLEALGLVLFVDVDGRLDGSPTFPEALDQGVRAAKAVLGCWSPWALTRPWVRTECAMAHDENKLVAVERVALAREQVPALFYLVDRKDLTDFTGEAPHEGWAMALQALATKLKLWAEKHPADPEAEAAIDKAAVLEKAALAERRAAAQRAAQTPQPGVGPAPSPAPPPGPSPAEAAWAAIEDRLEKAVYERFERTFAPDPTAFVRVIEAEARIKAIERWEATDQTSPEAIAETLRTGLFSALQAHAQARMGLAAQAKQRAEEERAARAKEERRAREAAEAEARRQAEAARKAEEERLAKPRKAAEAARAGRPVAERAFPIELFGVTGWPRPEMIVIPPGRFLMGAAEGEEGASSDEFPQHEVRIGHVVALGKHAVTFAEWDAAVAAGARLEKPSDADWGRGSRPVIDVSWEDAQAYLGWLNDKLGLTGRPDAYRLPSEAEWEYACRAGTTTPFSFGATISTAQANYDGTYTSGAGQKGEYREKTMPVGSFPANGFGLHDMHGNVWEWCEDTYQRNYEGAPADGSAWIGPDSSSRVVRGGSWDGYPQALRSANRVRYIPSNRNDDIGFRVARTVSPSNP